MKRKVAELEGALLDAAVAMAEGYTPKIEGDEVWLYPAESTAMPPTYSPSDTSWGHRMICQQFHPSREWHEGGPIIERERIGIVAFTGYDGRDTTPQWHAYYEVFGHYIDEPLPGYKPHAIGPTPLVAAMRCYVARKIGKEIDI
jgi:hypothetical protein